MCDRFWFQTERKDWNWPTPGFAKFLQPDSTVCAAISKIKYKKNHIILCLMYWVMTLCLLLIAWNYSWTILTWSSTSLHRFWSDCGPHFRNGELVYEILITLPTLTKIQTTYNYFIEKHGKSPCDSEFSVLGKWVDEIVSIIYVGTTEELI